MNESKFNMWRGCVAIVFLDGVVSPEERKWVEEKCTKLPLSDAQRQILLKDLAQGVKLENVLDKVTDKPDRAFLVNTFLVLANIDKNFAPIEKENFKKLEALILKGVNLKEAALEAKSISISAYENKSKDKSYNGYSLFNLMVEHFKKY